MSFTIGIDPGLKGGISVLMHDRVYQVEKMPVIKNGTKQVINAQGLRDFLIEYDSAKLAVIEKVHAMPGQGVTSMFNFGFGCGLIEGILTCLCIPFVYVTPQAWQKALLGGIDSKLEKKRSTVYCQQRWPSVTKWTDGTADATCMAYWGFMRELADASKFSSKT